MPTTSIGGCQVELWPQALPPGWEPWPRSQGKPGARAAAGQSSSRPENEPSSPVLCQSPCRRLLLPPRWKTSSPQLRRATASKTKASPTCFLGCQGRKPRTLGSLLHAQLSLVTLPTLTCGTHGLRLAPGGTFRHFSELTEQTSTPECEVRDLKRVFPATAAGGFARSRDTYWGHFLGALK